MSQHRRLLRLVAASALAAGLLLAVSACGDDGEDKAKAAEHALEREFEKQTGQSIDVDRDGGNLTIETEDGEVEVDASLGKAPDGWPADVPLDGLKILSGGKDQMGGGAERMMVAASSSASAEDTAAALAEALSGWTEASNSTLPGDPPTIMVTYELDGRRVGVTITEQAGATSVLINHTPES